MVLVLFCNEVKILVIFRCGRGDCMILLGSVVVVDRDVVMRCFGIMVVEMMMVGYGLVL